jgi:hypothetical protein
MRKPPRTFYVAAWLCVTSSAVASEPIHLPDPKEGQINGIVAVMFLPANSTEGGKVDTLLPSDDCHVVLAPWANLPAEQTYPCGHWFQPPEGRYRAWLESGERITPTTGTFNYAPDPFQGRGSGVIMPVGPAGRIVLASDIALPPNSELRLINLDSCCTAPKLGHPFDRRAPASALCLRSGVLMPVGRVFAGIFDHTTNEAIAITQPVRVKVGEVVTVAPRPPAGGTSDVYLSLIRPDVRRTQQDDLVQVTLAGSKPDMLFDGSDRIYAAWFGVKVPRARLAVASQVLGLPARTLTLLPGRVTTIREELQKLPSGKGD